MKKPTLLLLSLILLSTARAQLMPEHSFCLDKVSGFVENKGQVRDQYGRPNDEVRFTYSQGLFNLQLKTDGFSYELFEEVNGDGNYSESDLRKKNSGMSADLSESSTQFRSHRIDVKLLGAATAVEMRGEESTEASFNFYTSYLPQSGITGVRSYQQVIYRNIYPGIDLVFSAPDTEHKSPLKYEWIVHPGADPDKIELRYNGNTALIPLVDGGFQLMTSLGNIEESKVIAYHQDNGSVVPASYQFDGNRVSYSLTPDKNKTLVIDPNIIWSTYFGGVSLENNRNGDVTTNSKNQVIIVGMSASTQYIASVGAFQTVHGGGGYDAFMAEFSPNGKLLWATYYGSTKTDRAVQVAVDPSDNIYMAGDTESPSGIATEGVHQTVLGGDEDVMVAKFNNSGIRIWATYMGGILDEEVYGVVCDSYGNLYFSGYTISPNQIATPGAHQETKNGSQGEAIIGEFNPNGQLAWCSYYGGSESDRAHSLALGNNGDLFIQGTTLTTTQFATPGTHQTVFGGGEGDAFVAKWDTNGNFFWCSYYGGEDEDHGREIVTDQYGNAYIVGFTVSATGIASPGAFQSDWFEAYETNGTRINDAYIAKFHPDGILEWGTYYGGSGSDELWGLTIDRDKEVIYPSGRTFSPENISTPTSFQPDYSGSSDGFLAKFTLGGTRIWATYVGVEAGEEELFSVVQDNHGFLYLYMRTDSTFSVTPGAYQPVWNGKWETMLIKFSLADECYDRYEPNNSLSASKLVNTFSDTLLYGYTAAISDDADEDWFIIKVPAAGTNLKIELTDLPSDYDLKLYRANGQLLKTSTNPGTADEVIIYNNVPKGNYRLEIAHNDLSFDPDLCYRIRPMTSTSPWLLKPDDENGSPETNLFEVHIFPNPCSDLLNLKITSASEEKPRVTLYNLLYQPVVTFDFETAKTTQVLSVPVKDLAAGMYMMEITCDGNNITRMVAVQK